MDANGCKWLSQVLWQKLKKIYLCNLMSMKIGIKFQEQDADGLASGEAENN